MGEFSVSVFQPFSVQTVQKTIVRCKDLPRWLQFGWNSNKLGYIQYLLIYLRLECNKIVQVTYFDAGDIVIFPKVNDPNNG